MNNIKTAIANDIWTGYLELLPEDLRMSVECFIPTGISEDNSSVSVWRDGGIIAVEFSTDPAKIGQGWSSFEDNLHEAAYGCHVCD